MQLFCVNKVDFLLPLRYCVIQLNTFNVYIQNIDLLYLQAFHVERNICFSIIKVKFVQLFAAF